MYSTPLRTRHGPGAACAPRRRSAQLPQWRNWRIAPSTMPLAGAGADRGDVRRIRNSNWRIARREWRSRVASCSLRPFRAFYTVIESRVELPRDTQTLLNASHKSSDAAREAGSSQASPAEAERHGSRSDKGMVCCDISHARANGIRAYATAPARIKVHLSAFSWSSRLRGRGSQKS